MRYLSISKSGIWQFRYQIPSEHRHLFDGLREVKRSLKTSCKDKATLLALELEIQVRRTIISPTATTAPKQVRPIHNEKKHPPAKQKKLKVLCPEKMLERFCLYKAQHISPKAVGMLKAKCKTVLDLVGKSHLPLIRRRDAEDAVQLLRHYPVNMKKHPQFKGLTAKEAVKLNNSLNMPTLSEESIKDYCQKTSGFFEWCHLNEFTDINPFKAIRFRKQRKDSEAKNAYAKTDLQKIFSTEIHAKGDFRHPYYYWLPLLAYFTGARQNELCQLYKADIYQQSSIWVIRIDDRYEGQKLKNLTSRRVIPIHRQLIELGFIKYLHSIKHERVFPELKNSRDGFGSTASKWYGRFKTKLGFGKGHDFHSFRHTVATQLKQKQVSHIVAGAILGHTLNNITYDRYGKDLNIEQVMTVVNLIDPLPLDKVKNYSTE
ncbi:site-specific integrase [Vibrio parahaemolyticus]|uniref:site-specific integrase n=1 Tax=Vibrio parahaemolyticus TaxID=670 RepID=UPI0015BAB1A5|nr:site-specific integrase [Vibrio parahaemolyticus]EJB8452741.1 site-specific integrase [Vibrio parahaemolyticus]MBE4326215.1 site-specific integrase [Vibrio parahaemolyticus]QLE28228.1 site-specific integrase [Vibrio parahaemolyticus]HCE1880383.1 site-specific integrase [Vibrio parahaemolyticus]HCE3645060.1 site-specific integrase [Vibrio parahaemolyticus]